MQTIKTKYLGPTYRKGSRIKASIEGGISITIGYPYELSGFECHAKAVHELNKKLKWHGDVVAGSINKGDGYIFVFTHDNTITLI